MTESQLRQAIHDRTVTVSVIGQGYVGLPLAVALAQAGYKTYGIDVDADRVQQLSRGDSYILDVPAAELRTVLRSGRYSPTTDFGRLSACNVVVICVPTPLRKSKDPDVSYILSAVDQVKAHMHPGMLIILESTTYPGTTEELIAAELSRLGFVLGEDFFVCFSPERVDPGNPVYHTRNTPKVVGGITPTCTELGVLLYGSVMKRIVPVSSARVAEMVKLLENTFRAVNIGLVNELALMCERMDINIWEVVDAAATKPFGFMPFYPGPGIGGHCIPLDPMYLSWKAKMHDFYNKFIELASDINGNMPRHVVAKVAEALNLVGKPVRDAKILILGMAYKKDIDDLRESPSLEVYRLLKQQGADMAFADPLVTSFREAGTVVSRISLTEQSLAEFDCVVLTTDHSAFDYPWIAAHARLIVDTRNAFKGISAPHILRLGTKTPSPSEWLASVEALAN
jgi:UDP-N-acetyl-D-glucosamine dehydrogenase